MNERLPYEEQLAQQWNDLPLPDENMAWADMKRRLEKDDDDRIIPFWLTGCGLWTFIGVVLLGAGWWIFRPEKWFEKKKPVAVQTTPVENKNAIKNKPLPDSTVKLKGLRKDDVRKNINEQSNGNENGIEQTKNLTSTTSEEKTKQVRKLLAIAKQKEYPGTKIKNTRRTAGFARSKTQDRITKTKQREQSKENIQLKRVSKDEEKIIPGKSLKDNVISKDSSKQENQMAKESPVTVQKDIPFLETDSSNKKKTDSLDKSNHSSAKDKQQKNKKNKNKQIYFGAGLSLNQLLPVAGQKFTPYNSAGRKGSLSDYIPSVYFRMYRRDRWFLQSEFRYGAPQYTKDLQYKKDIVLDTSTGNSTITSAILKKTFYHQLPLTFNYFIRAGWSAGAGIVWNKFSSAISEQEVKFHIQQGQIDSVLSKTIIHPSKADSNFVNSYFQAVFETQYKWRRFSFGARYAFGLQPYIKFRLPGEPQHEEKNSSLNLFLRFELWNSKKK